MEPLVEGEEGRGKIASSNTRLRPVDVKLGGFQANQRKHVYVSK